MPRTRGSGGQPIRRGEHRDRPRGGRRPASAERTAPVARTVTPKPQAVPVVHRRQARGAERHADVLGGAAGHPNGRRRRPAAPPIRTLIGPLSPAQPRGGRVRRGKYGAAKSGAAQSGAAQYGPSRRYEAPQPGSAQYGANLYGGTSYAGQAAQRPSAPRPISTSQSSTRWAPAADGRSAACDRGGGSSS